jgi:hypothetical protein
VQHNVPGSAQNGISVRGTDALRSTLTTEGTSSASPAVAGSPSPATPPRSSAATTRRGTSSRAAWSRPR